MKGKMKITVLGGGGAFATMAQGNSSFLVEWQDRRILIDCGTTVPYVLRDEMGIPLQSITDVILTHCHADHIGGLEQLVFAKKYLGDGNPPLVWAHADLARGIAAALDAVNPKIHHMNHGNDSNNFLIAAQLLGEGESGNIAGLRLDFFRTQHVECLPSFALRLGPLGVSGDANHPVYEITDPWSQLLFHEAEFGFESGVHCPVDQLAQLIATLSRFYPESGAPLATWLYHCPVPAGFAGQLVKGQTFELEVEAE